MFAILKGRVGGYFECFSIFLGGYNFYDVIRKTLFCGPNLIKLTLIKLNLT